MIVDSLFNRTSLLGVFCIAFLMFSACQKEDKQISPLNEATYCSNDASRVLALINSRFDKAISKSSSEKKQQLIALKNEMVLESLSVGKYNDYEQMVLIPLQEKGRSINSASGKYLLVVVHDYHIYSMGIFRFTPGSNSSLSDNPIHSLEQFFNNEKVEKDGNYSFYTAFDKLKWDITFKDSKQEKYSYLKKGNNAIARTICLDWYRYTNYYDNDGNITTTTQEFLYTDCYDETEQQDTLEEPDDGGNGGGGNSDSTEIVLVGNMNWIVAKSQMSGAWGIESSENLKGKRDPQPSHPRYGIFTSAEHGSSYLKYVTSSAPGVPLATYQQQSGSCILPTPRTAKGDVTGTLHFNDGTSLTKSNFAVIPFDSVFP